jgi:PadR family transcriptional regulator PadR
MKADVLRGHLDPMILAVVERDPLHGYAIMEALLERSGGALDLPTGTYQLTPSGQKMLASGKEEWLTFRTVVEGVLRPNEA